MKWMLNLLAKFLHPRKKNLNLGKQSKVNWLKIGRLNGKVIIGENSIVNCKIDFDSPDGLVVIGDRSYIGSSHLVCHTKIEISDDVIISWGVTIVDHNSHSLLWSLRKNDISDWAVGKKNWVGVKIAPVTIHKGAWVGFGVSILKGVTIGEGSIVAAGAVVTNDVPPNSVVGGNPAHLIRVLDEYER